MYKLKVDKEYTRLCLIRIVNKHFIRNFTVALQAEITTRGVLATAKYICTFCLNQMKRTNKRQQSTMNDDDPTTSSQANSIYAIPKESILNGHFDC